jgi:hypothetical protein
MCDLFETSSNFEGKSRQNLARISRDRFFRKSRSLPEIPAPDKNFWFGAEIYVTSWFGLQNFWLGLKISESPQIAEGVCNSATS